MACKILVFLALAAIARASPIDVIGARIFALHTGAQNAAAPAFKTEDVASLLRTRLELLTALVSSGQEADLTTALDASSRLGPTLRSWASGLGLSSLLEKREYWGRLGG